MEIIHRFPLERCLVTPPNMFGHSVITFRCLIFSFHLWLHNLWDIVVTSDWSPLTYTYFSWMESQTLESNSAHLYIEWPLDWSHRLWSLTPLTCTLNDFSWLESQAPNDLPSKNRLHCTCEKIILKLLPPKIQVPVSKTCSILTQVPNVRCM